MELQFRLPFCLQKYLRREGLKDESGREGRREGEKEEQSKGE